MKVLEVSRVGMQLAERQLDQAASRIARAGEPEADVDLAKEMVSLTTAKAANAASVAVAHTASETLGTVIDLIV
jgi:replication-associated recombination protein RarA